MEILICTSNLHKVDEIKSYLGPEIQYQSFLDLEDFESPEETSLLFHGNAIIKATSGFKISGQYALADDSGLEVFSLGMRPGVFSARYAGINATDADNNQKLLDELNGVEDRRARFISALALIGPKKTIVVTGTIEGVILEQPRGTNGFGYDPLFYIPSLNKTMAELSLSEKNQISHRALALKKLSKVIETLI